MVFLVRLRRWKPQIRIHLEGFFTPVCGAVVLQVMACQDGTCFGFILPTSMVSGRCSNFIMHDYGLHLNGCCNSTIY